MFMMSKHGENLEKTRMSTCSDGDEFSDGNEYRSTVTLDKLHMYNMYRIHHATIHIHAQDLTQSKVLITTFQRTLRSVEVH